MCRYAGGRAAQGAAEAVVRRSEPVAVKLSLAKVNGYLGTDLSAQEVAGVLGRLHFPYTETKGTDGDTVYSVEVPGRRGDITLDVDLIEEVARLYGYDHIPTSLMTGVTTPGSLTKVQKIRRGLRSLLAASGFHEVISYSLTYPEQTTAFPGAYGHAKPIPLAMPMSEERSTLRTSLIPQLLETAQYNRNRNLEDAALFEIGSVFVTEETTLTRQPEERLLLSMLLTGHRAAIHWAEKPVKADFYDLKGVFEKAMEALGVTGLTYRAAQPEGFHPGRTAELVLQTEEGAVAIGRIGQLHPNLQRAKDLDDTYVLEVELDTLSRYADFSVDYQSLPRYPAVSRDIAVVVGEAIPAGDLLANVRETAGSLLESIRVFDIYTGERLGENRKSVALSLTYRHSERTLTDEEVTELHGRVVSALEQTFAAELQK
jgi:phenylalanyl-tRNA synthetase beta chain